MAKSLYGKALSQAVAGYSIIPLKKDKRPLITSWTEFQKIAATEEQIEGWWKQYPDANIGIITGKISGITVVDIDTHDKKNTIPLETFPPTFTVETPSGGYHLYYIYDEEIKQTANTYPQFPHVDIRNDGGYVVGPSSVTSYVKKGNAEGGLYKIVNKRKIAPFPRELFLTKSEVTKTKSPLGKKLQKVKTMKDGDGRNVALASTLGTLLRGQPKQNYPEIKQAFELIAQTMDHPLPAKEVEAMWVSITGKTFEDAAEVDLMVNDKGSAYQNIENVKRILAGDEQFIDRVVFDTFLQVYLYRPNADSKYRDLRDSDETTMTREISKNYSGFSMINPTTVRAAIYEQAQVNSIDCARDYVESITWDKTARLDSWLTSVYGVEDNAYHQSVGSNWMKGLVRRIMVPGSKFDYVLVLEGPQGSKKSTSLGILGGDWHVETTAAPDNKDFLMLLQGNVIVEFSEGETLSRGEIKQLKAVITTQHDKFRAPYDRNIQTHARRCVFAMTTNQTEYLKDETGNRRWLPVTCLQEADIEWLRTNRDQLIAEACHRVMTLKETTYEFDESIIEEQYKRQVSDPNQDIISEWYHGEVEDHIKAGGISIHFVAKSVFQHMGNKITKKEEMDIANVLKNHLKLEKRQTMVCGSRSTRWFDPKIEVKTGEGVKALTTAQMENDF